MSASRPDISRKRNERIRLLAGFLFLAFLMKVAGEVVHEGLGHGFLVLLFGGRITRIHISLLWPYELSGYAYEPPNGGFTALQLSLVHGGGILACLIVSYGIQTLLIRCVIRDWKFSIPLFWLSFWTFLNPAGYLLVGGIKPFGDGWQLINDGVLTRWTPIVIGLILFLIAFFSLTKILRDILLGPARIGRGTELRAALSLFWIILPLTTWMAVSGLTFLKANWYYLPLSLIPSVFVYILYERVFYFTQ